MTEEGHTRVSQIFLAAVELQSQERAAFLDRECADDAELRARVERLIEGDARTPSILESGLLTAEPNIPPDPKQIGAYEIVEKLGEGGMGVVYRALQNKPIRREAAIKLIRAGIGSEQVVARFLEERQALALMNHPNVARVFDAGSTEHGQPFLAMEFIEGEPITRYCDRENLMLAERLRLFVQVCEGVQHAHHKAIIHRDLKPSNVLVAMVDGKPVPKIIDFGVAKVLHRQLMDRTFRTEIGQFIGTPEYMSPEQASMSETLVDTRTDVYSLGAMLYELISGSQPYDPETLRRGGIDEIRRALREDDPTRPSSRIGPGALQKSLVGDLDWITMKALEKDPARRYSSPSELAADIRRHLNHEPVLAGSPSRLYQVRKFVRKYRLGVSIAATSLTLLVGFAATVSVLTIRLNAERNKAQKAVEAVSLVMDDLVGLQDPKTADLVTAKMRRDFGDPQGDPQELMRRLGEEVAFSRESSGPALEGAEHYLLSVVKLRRHRLGTDHPGTLRAEIALARVHQQQGRFDRAEPPLRKALTELRRTLGETHDDTLHARTWLASLLLDLGQHDEVRTLLTDAIPQMRFGRMYSSDGLISLYNLGCALAHLGETETALLYLRESLECGFEYEVLKDEQLKLLHGHPPFDALIGENGYIRQLWRAKEAAGVGDREGALSALRASVDGGLSSTVQLRFSNAFLPYLHDPDFVALIEEIERRPPERFFTP